MADDPRPWTPRLIQVREAAQENRLNYEESCISNTIITVEGRDPNQLRLPQHMSGNIQFEIRCHPTIPRNNTFKREKPTITACPVTDFRSVTSSRLQFKNERSHPKWRSSHNGETLQFVSVESKKHRFVRRIFHSLRLRRKVNSMSEGLETPQVIKEKSDKGFFKKFQQFFKREKKKKRKKRKGSNMTDDDVASGRMLLARPPSPVKKESILSFNVGDRNRIKEIFLNLFGSCFGMIKLNVIARSSNNLYIIGNCITILQVNCKNASAVTNGGSCQKKTPIMFEIHNWDNQMDQGPGTRPETPKPREPSAYLRKERPSLRDLEDKQVRATEKRLQQQIDRARPGTARRERVQQKKIDLKALEAERKRAQQEHAAKKQQAIKGKLSEIEIQRKEKTEKARARAEAARAKKEEREHKEMMARHRQALALRENLKEKRKESVGQVDVTAKVLVANALAAVKFDFESLLEGVSIDDAEDVELGDSSNKNHAKTGNSLIDDLNQALGDDGGSDDTDKVNILGKNSEGAREITTDDAQPAELNNGGDEICDDIGMDTDLDSDDGSISVGDISDDEDEDVWGIGDAFDNCPVRPTRPGTYIIKRAYDDGHVDIDNKRDDDDGDGDDDNNSIDSFFENPVGDECAGAGEPASAH